MATAYGLGPVSRNTSAEEASFLWSDLVTKLEDQAKLPHPARLDFPARLDLVLHGSGRETFQRELRAHTHDALSRGLLALAEEASAKEPPIPGAVRELAQLGARANPIVNFNVETLTSRLLGASAPTRITAFKPPIIDNKIQVLVQAPQGEKPHRHLYHPHGAITTHGICVMAASEYRTLDGTLAFQLATHGAFQQDLAIVGMSLEDRYLREQLSAFRDQIMSVY